MLATSPSRFDHTVSPTDAVLQKFSSSALLIAGIGILSTACASNRPIDAAPADEWRAYGRDALGSRFSPLADINRENVARLTVAWTYRTGEPLPTAQRRRSLEVTPIVVGGVMYISTPLGKVIALDPVTGAEKWKYDAKVDPGIRFVDFTNRGVSSWRDQIIFATTDARLIALDAATGAPVRSFGDSGIVDLRRGLRNAPFEIAEYEVTSPPAVINELVVI